MESVGAGRLISAFAVNFGEISSNTIIFQFMPGYITAIGTAVPQYKHQQGDIADYMIYTFRLKEEEAHKLTVLYRASGINERYSVLPEFSGKSKPSLFYPRCEDQPGTADRLAIYRKEAWPLAEKAISNCLDNTVPDKIRSITHLITVSCTGFYAPGLDLDIIQGLGLPLNIHRTSINFMGCYAAATALRSASDICSGNVKAKVLIVCLELCTLHFQNEPTDDNILANSLFSDGAAATLIESSPDQFPCFHMEKSTSSLVPIGQKEMTWSVGDFGFEMRLSSYIPDMLKQYLLDPDILIQYKRLNNENIRWYAIHPGGKKILTSLEAALAIDKPQDLASHLILRNYGNMSSPTLLFVLRQWLDQLERANNEELLFAMAFGPGLTIEGLVLRYHHGS